MFPAVGVTKNKKDFWAKNGKFKRQNYGTYYTRTEQKNMKSDFYYQYFGYIKMCI